MKLVSLAKSKKAGYTLVEIMLVLGTFAILAGISLPIYRYFQVKNYLDLGTQEAAQALRRAQLLSQAVEGDSNWGVKVESGRIILFKGTGFSVRDASFDEVFELPGGIIPSGDTEFVFAKLSGEPQLAGTLLLTSSSGEQNVLTLNSKGAVEY